MTECKCKKYLNDSQDVNFDSFKEDFELTGVQNGPSWTSGICRCKACGSEYYWTYEDFIYSKLSLRAKK